RVKDVVYGHAERLGLFTVHVHVQLWYAGPPERLYARKLGILVGRRKEFSHFSRQSLWPAFAAVLHVELKPTGVAQAKDGRRSKRQHKTFLDSGGFHEIVANQFARSDTYSFIPMSLSHENGRGIVAVAAAKEIEPGECNGELIGVIGLDRLEYFRYDLVSALQGGAVRQEHRADVVTLVLIWHQATRRYFPQPDGHPPHAGKQHQTDCAPADDPGSATGIASGDTPEPIVEPGEETQRCLVFALQDQHAQAGGQRQRDNSGQHHCYGDG